MLELCNKRLDVPVNGTDISIVHKLKQPQNQRPGPCPVIVRFVNRKVRDMVYAARRKLRSLRNQGTYDGSPQLPPI